MDEEVAQASPYQAQLAATLARMDAQACRMLAMRLRGIPDYKIGRAEKENQWEVRYIVGRAFITLQISASQRSRATTESLEIALAIYFRDHRDDFEKVMSAPG